jgi:uncharacterized SAM-binding protein YcdF (DUF218 family)
MTSFIYFLKGQLTVANGLVALLVLSFILYRYKKIKWAKILVWVSVLLFLLCSTSYLPEYLASKLERKYAPFKIEDNRFDTGKVLIHVLGSGYSLDERLPATAQLGLTALGRLAEGIRIHRGIKNSEIICSGNSMFATETQARVTKKAAVILGVAADELETLNTPGTTDEEAAALQERFNKSSQLIVVTDAIHMPRAIKLFTAAGFKPVAAPTNYKVNEGPSRYKINWWPAISNISLMNYVIHEWLGNIKASML